MRTNRRGPHKCGGQIWYAVTGQRYVEMSVPFGSVVPCFTTWGYGLQSMMAIVH